MAGHPASPADARIGRRIADARKAVGLTGKDLAGPLGISTAQLYKHESGADRVSAVRLHRIADQCGLPVSAFFDAPAPGDAAAERQQARCAAFNAAHPVGAEILVWTGTHRDGAPVAAIVAAPAACLPGQADPMVRVRGYGAIALTHVFTPSAGGGRQELFLDGARIEAESVALRVEPADAETLRAAARARGLSASELVLEVLRAVAADDLFDAVLDDRARPRVQRPHAEAA